MRSKARCLSVGLGIIIRLSVSPNNLAIKSLRYGVPWDHLHHAADASAACAAAGGADVIHCGTITPGDISAALPMTDLVGDLAHHQSTSQAGDNLRANSDCSQSGRHSQQPD